MSCNRSPAVFSHACFISLCLKSLPQSLQPLISGQPTGLNFVWCKIWIFLVFVASLMQATWPFWVARLALVVVQDLTFDRWNERLHSHLCGEVTRGTSRAATGWWTGQPKFEINLMLYPFPHKSCHLRVYLIFRQTWLKSTLLCDTANFQTETRCCSLQVKIRSLRERWYHDTWHEWLRNVKLLAVEVPGLGEFDPFVSPVYHAITRPWGRMKS